MIKIKLFKEQTPFMEKFEQKVNDFISANEGKIEVKNIQYSWGLLPSTKNAEWAVWTAMIVYEEK